MPTPGKAERPSRKKKAVMKNPPLNKATRKKTTRKKQKPKAQVNEASSAASKAEQGPRRLIERLVMDDDDLVRSRAQVELVDPRADRTLIRKLLLKALDKQRGASTRVGRGWVIGTLARVADDDREANSAVLETLGSGSGTVRPVLGA